MIVWGTRSDVVDLGPVRDADCSVCGARRPFHLYLSYSWFHLYWIFSFVKSRNYLVACSICKKGKTATNQEIEAFQHADPVPFMRRYGLVIFIVVVAVAVFVSSLQS